MEKEYILLECAENNEPDFIMNTAAEALDLLAQYNQDFTRDIDKDEVASVCRIISDYLLMHAEKLSQGK